MRFSPLAIVACVAGGMGVGGSAQSQCYPENIGDRLLGRYFVYEVSSNAGDALVQTTAMVARSEYGGLIACAYSGRPEDGLGDVDSIVATDQNGAVVWMQSSMFRAPPDFRMEFSESHRACAGGLGPCASEWRPFGASVDQAEEMRWMRRCDGDWYEVETHLDGVGGQRRRNRFRDDGAWEAEDLYVDGQLISQRRLVAEGEWRGGDCRSGS